MMLINMQSKTSFVSVEIFVCLFVLFCFLFVCFSLKADFEEGLKNSVVKM